MSKTNSVATEKVEEVAPETIEVNEPVEEIAAENTKTVSKKLDGTVGTFSAETQRMNARQFFDTYPHDNQQVVNLIITLYGNQIKTVAQWEAFYQKMLKKKVS